MTNKTADDIVLHCWSSKLTVEETAKELLKAGYCANIYTIQQTFDDFVQQDNKLLAQGVFKALSDGKTLLNSQGNEIRYENGTLYTFDPRSEYRATILHLDELTVKPEQPQYHYACEYRHLETLRNYSIITDNTYTNDADFMNDDIWKTDHVIVLSYMQLTW